MTILNTSVSGMSAEQNWLSSISQNVANSNTTGYKNVDTEFSTLVDQVSGVASDGGGVQTRTISAEHPPGQCRHLPDHDQSRRSGLRLFRRLQRGRRNLPHPQRLVRPRCLWQSGQQRRLLSDGEHVRRASRRAAANSLGSLQKVSVESAGLTAAATTSASLAANVPSSATPTTFVAPTSTTAATCTDQTSLVVYDGLGGAHTIDFYFTKIGSQGDGSWELDAYDGTNKLFSTSTTSSPLTFSPTTGALTSPSNPSSITFTIPNGASATLDLGNMTQLASSFSVSAATANGNAPSSLQGVSIGADGTLSFTYSSGASVAAYDIPLANVASPDNLASVNGNAYTATASSGPIFLGSANSGGFGAIKSSSLESSTVDIATELTDMIQAQSAYEANSKVFQTGANILDVLNNLKP